jgi:hypothetical protein
MKLIERADLEADPGESTHPLRKGKAEQAR